jgi:radical SAM protein with 4Fe4S-binding SPASM domain
MQDILRYAIEKGFDEIHFEYAGEFDRKDVEKSEIMGIKADPYFIKLDASILADKAGAVAIKKNLADISRNFNQADITISSINIDSLSVKNLYEGTIPHKKCYIERNVATVDPYGNLVACPFINNYHTGNMLTSSFKDIWNNEKHATFRKLQNSGGLPMCRHCILGAQRNPGVMKSLERIYLTRIKPVVLYR